MSRKRKKGRSNWGIPKNASDYFDPHYDDDFKSKHPILFWLTVVAMIVIVLIGPYVYITLISGVMPDDYSLLYIIPLILGFIFSFGISIGIANLFMIVHNQYLGHGVTVISFLVGIIVPGLMILIVSL